ncbi:hypothetical protein O181_016409 [Austropuccinia psidii MF-1]|uniref:Integrase catalytic domain-containing protein n=1 Tax=Austropuccinia psidii MF-1 TaxID=1389203 RepID=A0A9Q3GRS5_9BASI|nr:hypothetical protein [Austropuccinia psidii MF-1]
MKVKYSLPAVQVTKLPTSLWHQQLGHPGNQVIKCMGLPECPSRCSTSDLNKIHKLPFKHNFDYVANHLYCAQIDVVGPILPSSVSGNPYFLIIVDQATSFKIVRLLKNKSKAFKQFIIVKAYIEIFMTVLSRNWSPILEHKGYAKCTNRTILDKTRCLINGSGLPKRYWAEALNTAVLLISKHVRFDELDFPSSQSSSSKDKLEISGNIGMLDLGRVDDEVPPHNPVEAISETRPTEVNETEAVDEVCSVTPDLVPRDNSRGVDEFLLPLEEINAPD